MNSKLYLMVVKGIVLSTANLTYMNLSPPVDVKQDVDILIGLGRTQINMSPGLNLTLYLVRGTNSLRAFLAMT